MGKPARLASDENGIPVSVEDREDLVERSISSADPSKILAHDKMGRKLRLLRDTTASFQLDDHKSEVKLLKEQDTHCAQSEYLVSAVFGKLQ